MVIFHSYVSLPEGNCYHAVITQCYTSNQVLDVEYANQIRPPRIQIILGGFTNGKMTSSTQQRELEKCWIDVPTVGSFVTSPEKLYLLETISSIISVVM